MRNILVISLLLSGCALRVPDQSRTNDLVNGTALYVYVKTNAGKEVVTRFTCPTGVVAIPANCNPGKIIPLALFSSSLVEGATAKREGPLKRNMSDLIAGAKSDYLQEHEYPVKLQQHDAAVNSLISVQGTSGDAVVKELKHQAATMDEVKLQPLSTKKAQIEQVLANVNSYLQSHPNDEPSIHLQMTYDAQLQETTVDLDDASEKYNAILVEIDAKNTALASAVNDEKNLSIELVNLQNAASEFADTSTHQQIDAFKAEIAAIRPHVEIVTKGVIDRLEIAGVPFTIDVLTDEERVVFSDGNESLLHAFSTYAGDPFEGA